MRRVAIAAVLVGSLFVAFGCGDTGPTAAERKAAAERRAKAQAVAAAEKCGNQLGGFLDALGELNSRLLVGLNYDEYVTQVGDVNVIYGQLPLQDLDLGCLTAVGVKGERALNKYVDAADIWGDCISDLSCGEDIDPDVQSDWTQASGLIAQARSGLAQMREP